MTASKAVKVLNAENVSLRRQLQLLIDAVIAAKNPSPYDAKYWERLWDTADLSEALIEDLNQARKDAGFDGGEGEPWE